MNKRIVAFFIIAMMSLTQHTTAAVDTLDDLVHRVDAAEINIRSEVVHMKTDVINYVDDKVTNFRPIDDFVDRNPTEVNLFVALVVIMACSIVVVLFISCYLFWRALPADCLPEACCQRLWCCKCCACQCCRPEQKQRDAFWCCFCCYEHCCSFCQPKHGDGCIWRAEKTEHNDVEHESIELIGGKEQNEHATSASPKSLMTSISVAEFRA